MKSRWLRQTGLGLLVVMVAIGLGFAAARVARSLKRGVSGPVPSQASSPAAEAAAEFSPPPVLGAPTLLEDGADLIFQAGLKDYQKKDYVKASTEFYKASSLDPTSPAVHFFLGICYLKNNDTMLAIEELKMVSALSKSAYVEPSHFFLAKAYWRLRDGVSTTRELNESIALNGTFKHDAEAMKTAISSGL